MARKKKSNSAEDILELIAILPWWMGCALALVFYLLLHQIAIRPLVVTTGPGQISGMVTQSLWTALASVGQYVLPLLSLGGAAASFYRRRHRRNLVTHAANGKTVDVLNGMSWQEFELLVGEAFRQNGYQVTESGGGGADGGVDLVLHKGGEKFLVQCKQWKAFTVGVAVVRELYGVMAANGAAGGFVVTSGRYTDEAKAFASGRNVKLMDGTQLHSLIKRVKASQSTSAKPSALQEVAMPNKVVTTPSCPTCSKPMVQRTAKRGNSSGNAFWGCTGYPSCRGTRQIG